MVGNTTRYALAKRVLPQQGVISPILLNFVVDKILKKIFKRIRHNGQRIRRSKRPYLHLRSKCKPVNKLNLGVNLLYAHAKSGGDKMGYYIAIERLIVLWSLTRFDIIREHHGQSLILLDKL